MSINKQAFLRTGGSSFSYCPNKFSEGIYQEVEFQKDTIYYISFDIKRKAGGPAFDFDVYLINKSLLDSVVTFPFIELGINVHYSFS